MPELPEMQALSERLDQTFAGSALARIDLLQFSALKTVSPSPAELHGRELKGVSRRAKFLIFGFGDLKLLLHLSQGGRVDVEQPPKATKPRGALVRLRFSDRPSLLVKEFGTERKAAWWVLLADDPGPLEGLGPEPFTDGFRTLIREGNDRRRLHTMLRDQRTVAGIGRGFADDILHDAKLAPFDPLSSLGPEERDALNESIEKVLERALERERTREGGLPAKLSDRFVVHGRHGTPCPRCDTTLRRVSYESYEVTYCPECQTKGKVLADRRMSRLLR